MPTTPTFAYEEQYWQHDITYIAGVDEVGMGALAGPVVAAAVIFTPNQELEGIRDSKALTAKKREELFIYIQEQAYAWGIGEASVEEITELNIRQAAYLAMRRALAAMSQVPEVVLVDGNVIPNDLPAAAESIIKGDAKSFSIAAASILAKVHRDGIMVQLSQQYPQFGFESHKGYGSKIHMEAIQEYGPSPHHRPTYAPIAQALAKIG